MKVYVDTNILIDFLENRHPGAMIFIMDTLKCHHIVVISDHVLCELENQGFDSKLILELLRPKLILLKVTETMRKAATLIPTHYADALHIAAAQGCDILLTRNLRDFISCKIAGSYEKISKDLY